MHMNAFFCFVIKWLEINLEHRPMMTVFPVQKGVERGLHLTRGIAGRQVWLCRFPSRGAPALHFSPCPARCDSVFLPSAVLCWVTWRPTFSVKEYPGAWTPGPGRRESPWGVSGSKHFINAYILFTICFLFWKITLASNSTQYFDFFKHESERNEMLLKPFSPFLSLCLRGSQNLEFVMLPLHFAECWIHWLNIPYLPGAAQR